MNEFASVLIPTLNGMDYLKHCIKPLQKESLAKSPMHLDLGIEDVEGICKNNIFRTILINL